MPEAVKSTTPEEIAAAVADLNAQLGRAGEPSRLECSSENIEQGLAKLVLGLMELLRRLLERQAVRRMEGGSLTDAQVEEMGLALMKLEHKIGELAAQFGLRPEDLNLDLGMAGNLWNE